MNEVTATAEDRKILSLGFIGVGWIGRNRMEAIIKSGYAAGAYIAEPGKDNAEAALTLAPGVKVTDNPDEVLNSPGVDGVVIATPSAMHAAQSLKALKAGKAVFCQKPLGRNLKEVKEVVQAAEEADKLLSVDLSYRYTAAFKAVYDAVVANEIGNVYAVNLVFHNAYGPDKDWFYDIEKSGGGCVIDLGVHLADMAMCCLGFPEIVQVDSHLYSKGEKLRKNDKKVEDFARVNMLTQNGTAISLECSWHVSAGCDAVIEAVFFGTEGGLAFKNVNGSFYDFTAEKYKGTARQVLVSPPDDWGGKAGVAWAKQVAEGKGHDAVTAAEYIKTAEVIDRIYGRTD